MEAVNFKVKERIEILDNNTTYRSTIQDVRSDELVIDMPYSGNKYFIIHAGVSLDFFVSTEKDIVKCRSIVLGKSFENNIQLIILSKPQVIERVQRREFFRLPISMEARFYLLPENRNYTYLRDVPSGYFDKMEKIITIDISGGGIKVTAKQNALKNQKVILCLNLPEEINILCSVIRCERSDSDKIYKMALKYENLDERLQDKIIRFIFNKLREQSKLLR